MLRRDACRLRALTEDDLGKILEWRNSARIRATMYTDHLISMEEHKSWYVLQSSRDTRASLVFELAGKPVGVVNISKIDRKNSTCHWGFYIGESDAPKGCGMALGFLALQHIFCTLHIRKLTGEVFAFNSASIAFHKKLGFLQEGCLSKQVMKNGVYEDVLLFALFSDDWLRSRETLMATCFAPGTKYE